MSAGPEPTKSLITRVAAGREGDEIIAALAPSHTPQPPRPPGGTKASPTAIAARWDVLSAADAIRTTLWNGENLDTYQHNIENSIGTLTIPVGLAGPLRVNGCDAHGDFYVPLATTEAALVASYSRGCHVVSKAGGASTLVLAEGVTRSPGLIFDSLPEVAAFCSWAVTQKDTFAAAAASTTSHGRLLDMKLTVEGNHVYLSFEFFTGDAAGQNMVTIATQAICDDILQRSPVKPRHLFVEANFSGDKKASHQAFQTVRGRKVSAECRVPHDVLHKWLHTDAPSMEAYWRMSAIGGVLSGTIGVQGHYANGLAALFLATGQDAACVSEAAVGVTRFEAQADGALYAAVTLPNLIMGTVGGGTGLPSQSACLDLLGLRGTAKARALCEVAAALSLAGELSIIAALAAGHFTRAHAKLARSHVGTR